MKKSATIVAIAALGSMLAIGSATELMARGHGGGHGGHHEIVRDGGHGFHGGHGFGGHQGFQGNDGHFRDGFRRGHFGHFRHHYYYSGPDYSCGFPFLFGDRYYCQ